MAEAAARAAFTSLEATRVNFSSAAAQEMQLRSTDRADRVTNVVQELLTKRTQPTSSAAKPQHHQEQPAVPTSPTSNSPQTLLHASPPSQGPTFFAGTSSQPQEPWRPQYPSIPAPLSSYPSYSLRQPPWRTPASTSYSRPAPSSRAERMKTEAAYAQLAEFREKARPASSAAPQRAKRPYRSHPFVPHCVPRSLSRTAARASTCNKTTA